MLESETELNSESETEAAPASEEELRLKRSIARNVPQLVQLLLGIPEESTGTSDNYKQLVACAEQTLLVTESFNEQSANAVKERLSDFMLRLRLKELKDVADDIRSETKIVLEDPWLAEHPMKELACRLMEFYVSISSLKQELGPEEGSSPQENQEHTWLRYLALDDEEEDEPYFETDHDSDSNTVIYNANSNLQQEVEVSPRTVLPEHIPAAEQLFNQRVETVYEQILMPSIRGEDDPRRTFATDYGEYLHEQLQLCEQPMSEERLLLRELLIMFFAPRSCGNFVLIDRRLQLREDATQIAQTLAHSPILESLWQMQQLRQFIDCSHRLETFICFAQGLEQLLLPVMEFLVDYENRVRRGTELGMVQQFLHAAVAPMARLQLLADMLPLGIDLDSDPPAACCLQLLQQLFKLSAKPQTSEDNFPNCHAAMAATLLLHSLKEYCRILDSWWQTGSFQNHSGEFPFRQHHLDCMTSYVKVEKDRRSHAPRLRFISRHVQQAAPFVATLCDTRCNEQFVAKHYDILKDDLYDTFKLLFLHELCCYQVRCAHQPRPQYAPEILKQLQMDYPEHVLRLIIAYHNYVQQASIHTVLASILACSPDVPLAKIMRKTLKQLLHTRLLAVRCYTKQLLQVKFQLQDKLQYLVGVCMATALPLQPQKCDRFFELLEDKQTTAATWQLRVILEGTFSPFSSMIFVHLPSSNLAEIALKVPSAWMLRRVVQLPQMELLNIPFRLTLRTHQAQWMLRSLPQLSQAKAKRLVKALMAIKMRLAKALREIIQHPVRSCEAQQIHRNFLEALQQPSSSLQGLRHSSLKFFHQMSQLLSESTADGDPEEILAWAQYLKKLWLRVQDLLADANDFVVCSESSPYYKWAYKTLEERYLQTIRRRCVACIWVMRQKWQYCHKKYKQIHLVETS
ncbi:uncharacterized protein LOC117579540 [Drosophila guanche]|uniref:Gamma-tubulin complex component n=1 Tax=Drosophila guanche TaxID=7266 RepID=A0A3B0J634_DROGU|nr:uncharacterized protein LOC117579540 [Drosophila guanche]SPP77544.1 Hypothetical predicted protein [Drosophila guanche]